MALTPSVMVIKEPLLEAANPPWPILSPGKDLDRSDEGRGEPMSQDAGNAKGSESKATKTPKNKGAERLKCSPLQTPENDLRLTVLAGLGGPTARRC